jgi:hypothetical protein
MTEQVLRLWVRRDLKETEEVEEGIVSNIGNRVKGAYHDHKFMKGMKTAGKTEMDYGRDDPKTKAEYAKARDHGDRAMHHDLQRGKESPFMNNQASVDRNAELATKFGKR